MVKVFDFVMQGTAANDMTSVTLAEMFGKWNEVKKLERNNHPVHEQQILKDGKCH